MLYRFITLLILLLAAPAWGATLTVCASGCSYTTLQNASNAAVADDIIDGLGATFTEAFVAATDGTSGHPITYRNFTINGSGLGAIPINAGAWGAGNYTTWENVSVTNSDSTYHGFQFFNNIGIILTNCSATGNGGSGVLFGASTASHGSLTITGGTYSSNYDNGIIAYGGSTGGQAVRLSNITITGVTASSNLGAGIYVLRTDTATISNNTIDSNGDAVDGSEDYGIAINCCDDCTISGNTITNTTTPGSGAGVQLYSDADANGGSSNNLIFEKNKIIGTTGSMPALSFTPLGDNSSPSAIIRSNIISGASGRGISMYHEGGGTPSAPSICNNTITGNTGSAILNSGGVFSATIRNNIFSSNGAPELDFADASAGLTTSNNLWYRASGNVLAYNSSTYTTANIATFEATAVASDPLLNASYGLQGNSPAKDAGAVLYTYAAHPGDFIGAKVYGSAPDIGAIEYQDHTFGGWFFEMFIPTIFNLCASTNANCYTQP